MPLLDLDLGQNVGLARGQAAVCVPVYGAEDVFEECLKVLAHTDPEVPMLICDDASPGETIRPIVEGAVAEGSRPHTVHYLAGQATPAL